MGAVKSEKHIKEKKALLEQYKQEIQGKSGPEVIRWALNTFGVDKVVQVTSLQVGGQVITDMLMKINPNGRVITIDTGRLFQETYNTMEETMTKYSMKYEIFHPEAKDIEELTGDSGPNLFYNSPENRKKCCHVRKTLPLQRALSTADVWFTGLRKDQSEGRKSVEIIEWDSKFNLFKINPLLEWKESDIWNYVKEHGVPYNALYIKGYPSIGCMPCTRAVSEGEDVRAGRWWWEESSKKECGIHIKDGKIVRPNQASKNKDQNTLDYLGKLESRSISILREAYRDLKNLGILFLPGSRAAVLLHLARKAFFGSVPFPVIHIESEPSNRDLAEFRDKLAAEWGLTMIYGETSRSAPEKEEQKESSLTGEEQIEKKTNDALKHLFSGTFKGFRFNHKTGVYEADPEKGPYTGIIISTLPNREVSASQVRYFVPNDRPVEKDRPLQLWNRFKTDFAPGTHVRIYPLPDWNPSDIEDYIKRENITVFENK